MYKLHVQILWLALCLAQLTTALVTLSAIRNLTAVTDECRARIDLKIELVDRSLEVVLGGESHVERQVQDQITLGGEERTGGEWREEVEDTIAAAVNDLCSHLLVELEKPLTAFSVSPHAFQTSSEADCKTVKDEYHTFLESTIKFVGLVYEGEERFRWTHQSMIFWGAERLQALWASRRPNIQNRSFIEQQMSLYNPTGCFKKQEVLRNGVEMVEYMNDLIDLFG